MVLVKHYLRKLKSILACRYLFKILLILCLIYIFLFIKFDKRESIYDINNTDFLGIVSEYKYKDGKYTIYLECDEIIIVNYNIDTELDIKYGDTIKVIGKLSKPNNNTVPNLFNYKKYLERRGIYYILNATNIKKIKNNENLIYDIKNKLIEKINKCKKSSSYILAFVLGIKSNMLKDLFEKSLNLLEILINDRNFHHLMLNLCLNNVLNFIILLD